MKCNEIVLFFRNESLKRRKRLTVSDVLDLLEEEDDSEVIGVAIEPPAVREESDEDSEEDDPRPGATDHLSRFQLEAHGRILRARTADASGDEEEEPTLQASSFQKSSVNRRNSAIARAKPKYTFRLTERIDSAGLPLFPEPNYLKYKDFNPVQLFELFWDDYLIETIIVHQIRLYCAFKNAPDINPSVAEVRTFLGILIFCGYSTFSQRWMMHWSNDPNLGSDGVKRAMRKNRFESYMQFLHFQDNTKLDHTDRYTKLRPLADYLQNKFLDNFVPLQDLSHDEALIEYFGRNSLKQHIVQKPIRFGYEVFCLNLVNGYLVAFELYQGKKGPYNEELVARFGKSAAMVLGLLDKLPDDKKNLPFHITFDNRFTSLDLMCELAKRGYNATGTIRTNRVPKECKIKPVEVIKKEPRGSFAVAEAESEDGYTVNIVRWKDNNVVTTASTLFGSHPVAPVGRYSREAKTRVPIIRPHAIKQYNESMGGTDRQDQHVNNYRTTCRGKKWWFPIFSWLLDISVQNAWLLGRSSGVDGCQTLLEFRQFVANYYLGHYGEEPKASGRKSSKTPGAQALRFDRVDHLVARNEGNSRRRCANCGSRTVYGCVKCKVGLCPECFIDFHTKV